jgi:hypothetical protein
MKRLHDFKSFISESINESSSSEDDSIKSKILNYVLATNNKGGNPELASKTADEIASITKPTSEIFDYFAKTGLGSIPSLDIGFALFGKFGFLQSNLSLEKAQSIVNSSAKIRKMYETLTSSRTIANSSVIIKNAASQDIIQRAKENLSNWDEIERLNNVFLNLATAISDDTLSNLDQEEKDMFMEMFGKFISVYENAAKFKQQSPNLYKEVEEQLGDDADLAADLGGIGF